MTESERPNPDDLLASLKKAEQTGHRGTLKIFFGMAAGVGKTYAMLKAAQALKNRGTSVVVGYVETHGRPETEALLSGLPIVPRARISYKGKQLEDMDIDAILAKNP